MKKCGYVHVWSNQQRACKSTPNATILRLVKNAQNCNNNLWKLIRCPKYSIQNVPVQNVPKITTNFKRACQTPRWQALDVPTVPLWQPKWKLVKKYSQVVPIEACRKVGTSNGTNWKLHVVKKHSWWYQCTINANEYDVFGGSRNIKYVCDKTFKFLIESYKQSHLWYFQVQHCGWLSSSIAMYECQFWKFCFR
jgi:hypothetical protein